MISKEQANTIGRAMYEKAYTPEYNTAWENLSESSRVRYRAMAKEAINLWENVL